MNKKTDKKEGKKVIGVYLEQRLRNKIEVSAEKNRRSISAETAVILEEALDKVRINK
jgi:hypothetical protein